MEVTQGSDNGLAGVLRAHTGHLWVTEKEELNKNLGEYRREPRKDWMAASQEASRARVR